MEQHVNIRRIIAIAVLSLGVVGGYGSGIYNLKHRGHSCERGCDHSRWERWGHSDDDKDGDKDGDRSAAGAGATESK